VFVFAEEKGPFLPLPAIQTSSSIQLKSIPNQYQVAIATHSIDLLQNRRTPSTIKP
jgi:hypothetical protein